MAGSYRSTSATSAASSPSPERFEELVVVQGAGEHVPMLPFADGCRHHPRGDFTRVKASWYVRRSGGPLVETQVADQPLRLVWTKLHAPVRREHVQRTALLEQLTASGARLVLVRAPAGWGKSSLLADWSGWPDERRRFAWLALDRGDDDPLRFLLYVVEALRGLDPEIGRNALPVLLAPGVDLARDGLPVLLNELRDLPEAVLVLDDYHVIENPEIHALVEFVLEFGPPALTLAVATRSEPPLPVARCAGARAAGGAGRGRRCASLSPRPSSCSTRCIASASTPRRVTRLHERTEGWVAGLFLAALSLRGREDPGAFVEDFAGDDRHVADYLCAEVLAGQAPERRDFLLRTSILERFCPRLCDAVTGADGGARVLADIERSNLLLVPLDARREWYRYHHLFGELLRDQLALAEPGLSDELHRRAAAWLLQEGLIAEAITHQIAAGQIADAGELIAAALGAHTPSDGGRPHHRGVARGARSAGGQRRRPPLRRELLRGAQHGPDGPCRTLAGGRRGGAASSRRSSTARARDAGRSRASVPRGAGRSATPAGRWKPAARPARRRPAHRGKRSASRASDSPTSRAVSGRTGGDGWRSTPASARPSGSTSTRLRA